MINLQTQLAPCHKRGLLVRNPVVVASGTFGYGVDNANIAEVHQLGAITCKGTTLHPRGGNEQPRIMETASGMLNAIGLQNPGIHTVIEKYAPIWATWQTPVIVNIAGETIEEFVELATLLEGVEGVSGIEVNVSCPNVLAGGVVFGADAHTVAMVTASVRRVTTLPLIVKLSPQELRLSYPRVPVIGIGGISNANDALEFLMVGASAIQIGTINFTNPRAGVEIVEGIKEFMHQERVKSITELVGAAL